MLTCGYAAMKNLAIVIALVISIVTPVQAGVVTKPYVAIICSEDLRSNWFSVGHFKCDYISTLYEWDNLDDQLRIIEKKAGTRPIYLDMFVHGYDALAVRSYVKKTRDIASMGYAVNHIARVFNGHPFVLTFESCYAGKTYHDSIRGARITDFGANVEDCELMPTFPIYGAGPNFSTIGPIMYLQYTRGFRRWWQDLRMYDPQGLNMKVPPGEPEKINFYGQWFSETTLRILFVVESYFVKR